MGLCAVLVHLPRALCVGLAPPAMAPCVASVTRSMRAAGTPKTPLTIWPVIASLTRPAQAAQRITPLYLLCRVACPQRVFLSAFLKSLMYVTFNCMPYPDVGVGPARLQRGAVSLRTALWCSPSYHAC